LLFIDANKYLDLYRTKTGKLNLAALSQQANHIFVTQKVVDEVKRNKIKETASFLTKHWELAKAQTYNVPDHLFGAGEDQSKDIVRQMKEIDQKIKQVNKELRALAVDIMTKVSQSTDEVSTALAPIFANAMRPSDEQLQKAKERKERGDPPGKQTDPIGDQVSWEQILGRFVGKTKLWIITRDSDYGSMYGETGFFNQFLSEELLKVSRSAKVFLFENVADGIKHFAEITGVKADKVPSPEEIEEIKKEEETLPPYWSGSTGTEIGEMGIVRAHQIRRRFAGALTGTGSTGPTGAGPGPTGGAGEDLWRIDGVSLGAYISEDFKQFADEQMQGGENFVWCIVQQGADAWAALGGRSLTQSAPLLGFGAEDGATDQLARSALNRLSSSAVSASSAKRSTDRPVAP
jgi:hypothetical protein